MDYTKKELEEMAKAQSSSYSKGTTNTEFPSKNTNTNSSIPLSNKAATSNTAASIAAKDLLSKTQAVVSDKAITQPYSVANLLNSNNINANDTKTGSVITGGIPLAGFSVVMNEAANKTVESDGENNPIRDAYIDTLLKSENMQNNLLEKITSISETEETAPVATEETTSAAMEESATTISPPSFQVSDAYLQAMEYTNSLLSQMNSGRTSYTDQIEALLGEYRNREAFSYDASTDPMFQQMLAGYTQSGKVAMQDTIGQAAALTGGYGNTYGTAAGNAAYNQYLSEAYGNLPEYYNLALQAYDMEGQQMLNELGLLNDADQREYDRLANAYQANLGAAESLYDKEYTQYLNDLEQSNYEREFAYQQYMDALNQKNYENEFAYQQSKDALAQENYLNEFAYQQSQDALAQQNYLDEVEYQKYLDNLNYSLSGGTEALAEGYDSLSNADIEKLKNVYATSGGGDSGYAAVDSYLSAIGKNNIDNEALAGILAGVSVPMQYQDWSISKDTNNGGFLWFGKGVDHNDVYTNGSETMTYDELAEIIENSDMSAEEKKAFLDNLKSQSKR